MISLKFKNQSTEMLKKHWQDCHKNGFFYRVIAYASFLFSTHLVAHQALTPTVLHSQIETSNFSPITGYANYINTFLPPTDSFYINNKSIIPISFDSHLTPRIHLEENIEEAVSTAKEELARINFDILTESGELHADSVFFVSENSTGMAVHQGDEEGHHQSGSPAVLTFLSSLAIAYFPLSTLLSQENSSNTENTTKHEDVPLASTDEPALTNKTAAIIDVSQSDAHVYQKAGLDAGDSVILAAFSLDESSELNDIMVALSYDNGIINNENYSVKLLDNNFYIIYFDESFYNEVIADSAILLTITQDQFVAGSLLIEPKAHQEEIFSNKAGPHMISYKFIDNGNEIEITFTDEIMTNSSPITISSSDAEQSNVILSSEQLHVEENKIIIDVASLDLSNGSYILKTNGGLTDLFNNPYTVNGGDVLIDYFTIPLINFDTTAGDQVLDFTTGSILSEIEYETEGGRWISLTLNGPESENIYSFTIPDVSSEREVNTILVNSIAWDIFPHMQFELTLDSVKQHADEQATVLSYYFSSHIANQADAVAESVSDYTNAVVLTVLLNEGAESNVNMSDNTNEDWSFNVLDHLLSNFSEIISFKSSTLRDREYSNVTTDGDITSGAQEFMVVLYDNERDPSVDTMYIKREGGSKIIQDGLDNFWFDHTNEGNVDLPWLGLTRPYDISNSYNEELLPLDTSVNNSFVELNSSYNFSNNDESSPIEFTISSDDMVATYNSYCPDSQCISANLQEIALTNPSATNLSSDPNNTYIIDGENLLLSNAEVLAIDEVGIRTEALTVSPVHYVLNKVNLGGDGGYDVVIKYEDFLRDAQVQYDTSGTTLYVTTGYANRVVDLEQEGHYLLRLTDTDGDGWSDDGFSAPFFTLDTIQGERIIDLSMPDDLDEIPEGSEDEVFFKGSWSEYDIPFEMNSANSVEIEHSFLSFSEGWSLFKIIEDDLVAYPHNKTKIEINGFNSEWSDYIDLEAIFSI